MLLKQWQEMKDDAKARQTVPSTPYLINGFSNPRNTAVDVFVVWGQFLNSILYSLTALCQNKWKRPW